MSMSFKKMKDETTYKLVVNDPLNEPGWVFFIIGIVECNFNSCIHNSNIDVFLGFEGFDGMRKLFNHMTSRKPEGMFCQKSKH
jgi:hypothetical protein